MTIKIKRSELANMLGILSPYISGSMSLGIRTAKKSLEVFVHTDHGSALARVPCKAADHEWVYVDGKNFHELVKLADDGQIEINFTETGLTLKFLRSTNEFRSARIGVPPEAVKFGQQSPATIKGKDLALLATMTEAASDDEVRPNLNGIFIAAEDGSVKAAAADGYILSFASIEARNLKSKGALYSVMALNRAKRAIKPIEDDDIAIGIHKGCIALSVQRGTADFFFEIPSCGETFPDYMAIVNAHKKDVTVKVETRSFDSFLKRSKAIEGHIYMQVLNGFLWMMSVNEENKSIDSIAVETEGGESQVMHYSTSLLKDVVKASAANSHITLNFPKFNNTPMLVESTASVIAMPLVNELKKSPFKDLQPALI